MYGLSAGLGFRIRFSTDHVISGDISTKHDRRYDVSAGHNYRFDLQQIMFVGLVFNLP